MYKICKDCGEKCDLSEKKCPVCGGKLKRQFTEEELKEIHHHRDIYTHLAVKKNDFSQLVERTDTQ